MPIGSYKLWQFGGPVGQGVMDSYHVGIHAIAKKATFDNPMAVVNEVFCAMMGRALTMPIPPHGIVFREEVPYHFSLNFNLAGESLPPCRPDVVVSELPELSCGVVLFDSWILNADRHDRNIAYLPTTNEIQLFDHSHAFLPGNHGVSIFDYYDDKLPLQWHCLAREMTSLHAMPMWIDRMNQIPEFWIDDALESARAIGLRDEDVEPCKRFIFTRRNKLPELLKSGRSYFPKVQPDLWDSFEEAVS